MKQKLKVLLFKFKLIINVSKRILFFPYKKQNKCNLYFFFDAVMGFLLHKKLHNRFKYMSLILRKNKRKSQI